MTVRLNPAALASLEQSAGALAAAREVAEVVADSVRAQGVTVGDLVLGTSEEISLPVQVNEDGSVSLAHPAGQAVQAKHGSLTKAAAQAGLRVQGGKP